ncbi:MAG TPA: hypothetical protein VFA10_04950 [Ktedonobacteraceae bacterium]|nr:hypothetical protein [Ktedonobacteraceae bacterium]
MTQAGEKQAEEKKELLSPCHQAVIEASLGDGVLIGSCSACGTNVVRVSPRTGKQEWLDGESPWTQKELRLVEG